MTLRRKNPAAVALGRRGGLKGGKARAASLTPEERRDSARRAVQARWERRGRSGVYASAPAKADLLGESVAEPRLYNIHRVDCFEWLQAQDPESIHAVVTDPPYGLLEFTEPEKAKLRSGKGGVWRIPPSFDGNTRSPLPRFTVLSALDHQALTDFFSRWAALVHPVLAPGAHVLLASNPLLADLVSAALRRAGLEKRGEIIRLVQTLRGGDRPKNAHDEFPNVTVMPRSCYEPWLVFRKPCEGRVQDTLRRFGTGGLRRISAHQPFRDVIVSSPTRKEERAHSPHPALKPQAFMRQIVRASLPLGRGTVLDPFMGGGSTIAAAAGLGYRSIGLEDDETFFAMAQSGIPRLARIPTKVPTYEENLTLDLGQAR